MENKGICRVLVEGRAVALPVGSLLQDAVAPAEHLAFPCAGQGRCGKCRVRAEGALSAPNEAERQHLTHEELAQGWRLACQARALGNCTLWAAPRAKAQICTGDTATNQGLARFGGYGVAADIGTTTLAAQLYGQPGLLAQATRANPQARFGADVISRVEQALAGKGQELAACIRQALCQMVEELCEQACIHPKEIEALVITGNTCMLMLLAGHPPGSLAAAPFEADRLFGETMPARLLGLPCPGAEVYLPPCISAFVGADITAALLAAGMTEKPNTSALLVDAGTNGEVALWHENRLVCCSTAAGPAFEGAGLSMGMPGQEGAVEHLRREQGRLVAQVIGHGAPRGICGSGVIDALACLLESGQMDEAGLLAEAPAMLVAPVVLSQRDVRMVQLAKGAIRAGLETLLAENGLTAVHLDGFYVAGGFGSYIDMASAANIGLFPGEIRGKETVLGNAALTGAAQLLLHRPLEKKAADMAQMARVFNLAASPAFQRLYVEHMLFGPA